MKEATVIRVSPHFTLSELTKTEVRQLQAANTRDAIEVMPALTELAELLENIRAICGSRPVVVHSGYRSRELNTYIGGSRTSQHCKGEAADFHVVGLDLHEVFERIRKSGLKWGQLILEDGDGDGVPTWIHVSTPHLRENQQVLLYDGHDYLPG